LFKNRRLTYVLACSPSRLQSTTGCRQATREVFAAIADRGRFIARLGLEMKVSVRRSVARVSLDDRFQNSNPMEYSENPDATC
jgi:hypothetical protein